MKKSIVLIMFFKVMWIGGGIVLGIVFDGWFECSCICVCLCK